mmetsp:Transcript_4877/g.8439  ORF Transcript_4877/g.8439 Transcript_4877/m.8439 type:complete len:561 (+) Transcript_4877:154-1836(+)|eukprot:CAMPEP_0198200252 /NCGR_PEP_ID=MMETSP1445-20131203/3300_1 /TAXON_ID=36898 /ORGANISM="Pyramimonas sp., Strain CCMP2087" /LENGTH=560 /DNA_ID=CAMNT_0043870259 /DNA_START=165 /DNA_END=1847 /DNA_ORIENTATION=-
MRAMISLLAVAVCLSISKGASAALVTTDVSYLENGVTLHGYAAYDNASANAKPVVVIVPQWSGLGNYEKKRAVMLADLGYFAFAADIYGVGALNSTSTMADWGVQAGIYRGDVPLFVRRIAAAVTEAKSHDMADGSKVVAIGYCFGGTGVINYAISGADVLGVVSFHGGLTSRSNASLAAIPAKVLVLSGGTDDAHSEVSELEDELTQANATWEITRYGHVLHSFTEWGADSPGRAKYDMRADMRSWETLKLFLAEVFNGTIPATYTNTVDHTDASTIVKGHVNYTDSHDLMNMPVNLTGYHAYDSSLTAPLPIVVVIPTWTGLGEYVMQRVEMLAELGYYAFAADIYGPDFPADAGQPDYRKFSTMYNSNTTLYVNRIHAGIMKAKEEQWGDASKIAAIGYCFGGTGVLNLAITGGDVLGVVSFHGGLVLRANVSASIPITAKVLVLSGGDDDPQSEVNELEGELNGADATWEMSRYGHVVHGFTEWNGRGYNARADMASWNSMKMFLHEIFVAGVVGSTEPVLPSNATTRDSDSAGSLSTSAPYTLLFTIFAASLFAR